MRIAFTHNLQLNPTEEEAEFDTPKTVDAISEALARLGHQVERVEVSGPASRTVARLEALAPDLVFNTAEGRTGRYREAFYPGLFEHLSIPYTGSDGYVCALTLDKQLTKMLVARHGIPTPGWAFVDDPKAPLPEDLAYPLIVKPNFEGSSKGITQDSVVEDRAGLEARVAELLARYPTGLLVEEYIVGRDVVVPFLEKAAPATGGVLAACEYDFDPKATADRRYRIYDYALKQVQSEAVNVRCPADLDPKVAAELAAFSRKACQVLGVRDLGRIDYRITDDGRIYFIEMNALPSLEPGAGIYDAAARAGLKTMDSVLEVVVKSAAARQGLQVKPSPKRIKKNLRVGLAFNMKRVKPVAGGAEDTEAEYDAPKTIEAIKEAIASYGHEVVELEATPELPQIVAASQVDVVFNIAEGIKGRNRESQIPALLELLDIPYTGSDPAALSLALDKGLAKRIVAQAGVATPAFLVMTTGKERLPKGFRFPAMVKPVAEGSSKGVMPSSVVEDEAQLREVAREMAGRYRQGALVEHFLTGREFTVGLLGERRPKALPPMEIVFLDRENPRPIYTFDHKLDWSKEIRYDAPATVDPPLLKELERAARTAFQALGCRDVARVDLRLDADGKVNFIECNPLPGLTPGWSDLCLIGKSAGMDYRTLIGEILAPAIRRWREQVRASRRVEATGAPGAAPGADPAGEATPAK
jgi:D-alanine-D-alanine ligase